jgi:hypothetical protein
MRPTGLPDQLRLVAFEAILAQFPKWMIAAVYEAADRLENETSRQAQGPPAR